jgi:hypothetical protein
MDGMYPDDLNKKPQMPQAPAPNVASERPPEDADLYLSPSQRKKPTWRKAAAKTLKIALVILIVAALAAVVYWKFFHHKTKPAMQQKPSTQTVQTADAFTAKTKNITSENVGLTLSYPETWNAEDAADKLTVTSPITQLIDTMGQAITGKIALTVQPKGAVPKAFDSGGVISALDSQKIKYTRPTPIQRGQTYMTFLQYAQTLAKGQLDGIYVTGDFGYQTNQYVPKTDIAKLDPLILVTFLKCDNDACANPTDTSIQSDMWANDADFQKSISTMLKSIQVDK